MASGPGLASRSTCWLWTAACLAVSSAAGGLSAVAQGSLDGTRSQPTVGDIEVVLPTRLVEQEQRAGVDHPQEVRARDLPQGRCPIDQHEDGRSGTDEKAEWIILEGLCLSLLLRLCNGEVGQQAVESNSVRLGRRAWRSRLR